jgi:PhzF family phenazine biosynthesis protein
VESTHGHLSYPIFVVDAFTSQPFGGNPAAVVLGRGEFETEWMQQVAAEMKHAETAFVVELEPGEYNLRWFTPEVEVDLCGHATLASAHVLYSTDRLAADRTAVFHTRGGDLRASHSGADGITLDFPIAVPEPEPPHEPLFDALAIDPREFLRTDGDFFMCVVDDWKTVAELRPDFAKLRVLNDVRGVYVTAEGDRAQHDIVSRCFAPRVGIDEDAVTGSMHCVLAAYWCPRLGTDVLRAYQASARGGSLVVTRKDDRVLLTGHATTVLDGLLHARSVPGELGRDSVGE